MRSRTMARLLGSSDLLADLHRTLRSRMRDRYSGTSLEISDKLILTGLPKRRIRRHDALDALPFLIRQRRPAQS
jgi:hypothetical protein